jgi:uncharacterized RDD family membrane protein YckC
MPDAALSSATTTTLPAASLPAEGAVLGSRGLRFAAAIIDTAMIIVPVLLLATMTQSYVVGGVLYVLALLLYAPLLLARSGEDNGQTVGKETLGLRVVSLDRSAGGVTLKQACLRELVGRSLLNVCTLGLYGFFDAAWCLFDPNKQTLHDKIAGTIVVTSHHKKW